ncbi:MAG: hypothetical protein RR382_03685 [Tannerellaceae bacterium]
MNKQLRGNLLPFEKTNGKNWILSFLMIFMALLSIEVNAQNVKITGSVIGEVDKYPIIGANVLVKGTTIGTTTDIDKLYGKPTEITKLTWKISLYII